MPLIREVTHDPVKSAAFYCPGCHQTHLIPVEGPHGWQWNGSHTVPTFSPSILVTWGAHSGRSERRCHSFIVDGKWQFLADCTHDLAGKTVPMVDLPTTTNKEGKNV
jgi:hypothetical protein